MRVNLHTGDVMDYLGSCFSESFDALLCDPPYGLAFMGAKWDGRVPGPEVWREVLRVLKPGAFGLVFGGTRTFHRLAVALEDAGFDLADTLMWMYASGMPKGQDISKAIDKLAGAEREVVGTRMYNGGHYHRSTRSIGYGGSDLEKDTRVVTTPATLEVQRWEGYNTTLKPSYEPILLVRKPTKLTFARNVLEHGTGALNIDGTRVPVSDRKAYEANASGVRGHAGTREHGEATSLRPGGGKPNAGGRWPANVILDDEAAALLDEQTGILTSGRAPEGGFVRHAPVERVGIYGGGKGLWRDEQQAGSLYSDSGGASRFFNRANATGEDLRFLYTSKASPKERNAGLSERNPHPTVKPLALTTHLAKLLLPPERADGERTHLLVPFAGVMSEVIGAGKAGWGEATAIELDRFILNQFM